MCRVIEWSPWGLTDTSHKARVMWPRQILLSVTLHFDIQLYTQGTGFETMGEYKCENQTDGLSPTFTDMHFLSLNQLPRMKPHALTVPSCTVLI